MGDLDGEVEGESCYEFDGITINMRDKGCSNGQINKILILDEMTEKDYQKPLNLRNVERSGLKAVTEFINVMGFINT